MVISVVAEERLISSVVVVPSVVEKELLVAVAVFFRTGAFVV